MLIHLVDGTQEDPVKAYRVIRKELKKYAEDLAERPEIVAINKIDAMDDETKKALRTKLKRACGHTPHLISGVSGEGVRELLFAALATIQGNAVPTEEAPVAAPYSPWEN